MTVSKLHAEIQITQGADTMNIHDEDKKLRGLLSDMFQHSCTIGPGVSKEFKAAQRAVEARMEALLVQRANAAVATAGTQPTRCLTQWPWVGAEPGGACGPDATVGGLRSECHHRCCAAVGHQGLCRCECGKLQTTPAVDVQLTVDDVRHLREQAMDAAEAFPPPVPTWRPIGSLSKSIPGGSKLFLCQGHPLLMTSHAGWAPPDATHWCPMPVLP